MTNLIKEKSKVRSAVESVVYAVLPFVATVIIVLVQFVTLGAQIENTTSFWVNLSLSGVALLFYFFPFKQLFKNYFMGKERMRNKLEEYAEYSSRIYDGNLRNFADYCDEEWRRRRNKYAAECLQLFPAGESCKGSLEFDEFIKKYGMSYKRVYKDKELSQRQKRMAYKLIYKYGQIKKVKYESVLPGIDVGKDFNRLRTSMRKSEKFVTARKVVYAVLIALATVSITISADFSADAMAIAMQITIRLAAGLWQIFMALVTANHLVNDIYFEELSQKSLFMVEFFETSK